jgi:Rieske Fe-S protein
MQDDLGRLDRLLDALATEYAPDVSALEAEDAALLETAVLLKNAAPGRGEPDPEFLSRLGARLTAASQGAEGVAAATVAVPEAATSAPAPTEGVTRRRLLGRAAVAVAGLAAGAGADELLHGRLDQAAAAYDRGRADGYRQAVSGPYTVPLAPSERGTWMDTGQTIDTVVVGRAVRFRAGAIEGFLVNPGTGKPLYAVSAACTHMGCLLSWLTATGTFLCPCHGAQYQPDGTVLSGIARHPLPRIEVRVGAGGVLQVWSVSQQSDSTTVLPYSVP